MGLKTLTSSLLHEVLSERLVMFSPVSLCVIACLPLDLMKIRKHFAESESIGHFYCIATTLVEMLNSCVLTASILILKYT